MCSYTLLVGIKWYNLLQGQLSIVHQALLMLHCLGPNSTVGSFPKEISQIYLKTSCDDFLELCTIMQYWKEPKCPKIIDSLNKLLDIHSEFFVVIR